MNVPPGLSAEEEEENDRYDEQDDDEDEQLLNSLEGGEGDAPIQISSGFFICTKFRTEGELGVTGAVTQVSAALRTVLERESSKVPVSGSISSLVLSSPCVHDTETMKFEYNPSLMFSFFCSSPELR